MDIDNIIVSKVPQWFKRVKLGKCLREKFSMKNLGLQKFENVLFFFVIF